MTKIMAAFTAPGRQVLMYQNDIKTDDEEAIMMLPFPTKGRIELIDSTPFSKMLNVISERVIEKEHEGSRGLSPKDLTDFKVVGQYRYKTCTGSELLEMDGIPSWLPSIVEKYNGWNWLLCYMAPNSDISAQPLMVEFDSTIDSLYYPMMDIHGDSPIQELVRRDHILITGDPELTGWRAAAGSEFEKFPYPELKFAGFSIQKMFLNGDAYATLTEAPNDPRFWNFKMK